MDKRYFVHIDENSNHFTDIDQIINFVNGFRHTRNWEDELIKILENTKKFNYKLKKETMKNRKEIYNRIDSERDYQDEKWGSRRQMDGTPDEEKPIAEWINYMEYHISRAKEKVYLLDKEAALHELRKVTALGVRAMEIHGCPERK